MKLCHAGSVLFQDCNIKFFCNPNKKPHTVVDFPLAEGMLFSKLSTEMDVNQQIHSLSRFLECCLEEWIQYVNRNRQVIHVCTVFTFYKSRLSYRNLEFVWFCFQGRIHSLE